MTKREVVSFVKNQKLHRGHTLLFGLNKEQKESLVQLLYKAHIKNYFLAKVSTALVYFSL